MDGCVFCGIIEGSLPAVKIYEDEYTVVFLDIYPANPGHALVVPKIHSERLEELPPRYRAAMMEAAARVAPAVLKALGYDSYNLLLNNGRSAGQEVMHVHLHLIPQSRGSRCRVLACPRSRPSFSELEKIGRLIRSKLG